MAEDTQWWTVRRTWYVQAASATDALDAAKPGDHDDVHVFASPPPDTAQDLSAASDQPS